MPVSCCARKLPTAFEDALGFVPIAVLTAIIVPAVLVGEDDSIMLLDNTACQPRSSRSLWHLSAVQLS